MMSLSQKEKLRLWPTTWYRDKTILGLTLLAVIFNLHIQVSDCADLQAPRFITPPSALGFTISEGRNKMLHCQAVGYPELKFRWIKDGKFVTEISSKSNLTFATISRSDAGNYQCMVTNQVGTIISDTIPIVVAYMLPFNQTSSTTVKVKAGHAAILEFPPIDSVPPPVVIWQTEDEPQLYGEKYAVVENNLIILSVDKSDEMKKYRARATNTQLGEDETSGDISLEVYDEDGADVPPEILFPPKDQVILKGSYAELHCIANARPIQELEIVWLKDGQPLSLSGIDYESIDLFNRTLGLRQASWSHEGVYSCLVRMKTGGPVLTKTATVTIIDKPRFKNPMKFEVSGEFGKEINLPCDVVGTPDPNVTWYRDGVPLAELPNLRYKTMGEDVEKNYLKISFLKLDDSGMFQCKASNEAGEVVGYSWLRVKTSAPTWTNPPANLTALDGMDANINCSADGAPAPNVTWFFKDGEITHSGRIQILEDGSLLISKVRSTDRGKYTCIRANEAGSERGQAYLSVLVRTQIFQPPSDSKVILGHVASLTCKVSADRNVPFEINWYHDNKPIDATSSHRIGFDENMETLTIAEARASDAGRYTCEVASDGGNDRHSANLDVIELPYSPTIVGAERVPSAHKTVNVTWTPSFNGNSPIIKYILQYRPVPASGPIPKDDLNWATVMANISSSSRSVQLNNLRSSAAYIFRISAVNSVGEGPQSKPSERVVLPQEPPSGPPLNLVGSARSESEIMIQWQPPAEDSQNGDILGYVVRYRLFGYHDSPWSNRNITKQLQRNYLITELITWKDYEIQIAAYNQKGVGSYSGAIKVKTREGVPSAAPTGIRAQAISSTEVRVWWLPPDPQQINGINQGYKLQAWIGDPNSLDKNDEKKTPVATVTVAPNLLDPMSEQSAIIDNLVPWTAYNVTVVCFTSPGDGMRSVAEYVRTLQDYPGPVSSLRFEEITDRGVKVLWDAPQKPNGVLLGYTIRYMVKDMIHTLVDKNLTSDELSFHLNSLKPSTHYTFEVYALTEVGRGKASTATIQSGVEPVLPNPPVRLAVSNIEPFSVMLQFTPGFDGNSSITKWTVQALSARNASWTSIYEVADPEAKSILVKNLLPYMDYQLRVIANNVVGASDPSEPTRKFQTIQAPPSHPPRNVTIRAMSATELRVRWIPLSQGEWYGIPRGYNISYKILDDSSTIHSVSIEDPTKNSFVLEGLEEFTLYEVILQAYNDIGSSEASPTIKARTKEAPPGAGPSNVQAEATSSTTILVKWGDVSEKHRNGIIEGYKVYFGAKDVPRKFKTIDNNSTKQTTLTELRKFTFYTVQVLAYTRLGDGVLSEPRIQVQTHEDVPGPPSNVSFPDVSLSTARIIWDVPSEPNGEILKYRVTYRKLEDRPDAANFTREFLPTDRTFRAVNLEPTTNYEFQVTAKTSLGWGLTARGLVLTTNNREAPQPPSAPQVSPSQIQDREITFSWNPGNDGYGPLRYYTVQYAENNGGWHTVPEQIDPLLSSYTVSDLKPFSTYKFRMQAVNDIGSSGWSKESNVTQTLPSAPSVSVEEVKVTPISRTNVHLSWTPLPKEDFNGDPQTGGYIIEYRELSDFPSPLHSYPRVQLKGIYVREHNLSDLTIGKNYEIIVIPYNSQGNGPPSRPVSVYVGEAVPTGSPRSVKAEAVSATEVRVSWRPPKADQQNGDLSGYKIFYHAAPLNAKNLEEIEVISATDTSHSLIFLEMYTNYTISILAFNPAGDGPRSDPLVVQTLQGIPGPPSNLKFSEITMNTLKVSWDLPLKPNGEIIGYIVAYETAEQDENYSKQVKQRVSEQFLFVHNLEEEVTYTFSVRAQTLDYGPAVIGNVTTGPQPGSPMRPKDLTLSKTISAVKLAWTNGPSGKGPILGYYIESRRKDEDKWKTEAKTEGGAIQEYTLSYQNLVPSTSYTFRVIGYNKFGISFPVTSTDAIQTPSKRFLEFGYLQTKPFYREPWFLVALAAASIVIIIMVVAILCVKSKSYKYKDQAKKQRLDENPSVDDNGYETFKMRQSRRGTMSGTLKSTRSTTGATALPSTSGGGATGMGNTLRSTASRKSSNFAMINGTRNPPRPAPSMVNYSDEDSAKGYDENPDDSDSLTEKPSEISSTDSQGTESERESRSSEPHSFVNHYANVNSTFRQSWKKQKAVAVPTPHASASQAGTLRTATATLKSNVTSLGAVGPSHQSSSGNPFGPNHPLASSNPRGYSSFTESSDHDGSSAVVSLNGTQIVMNNMARSRAPLPGFSSFV